jgi:hypothetical protein
VTSTVSRSSRSCPHLHKHEAMQDRGAHSGQYRPVGDGSARMRAPGAAGPRREQREQRGATHISARGTACGCRESRQGCWPGLPRQWSWLLSPACFSRGGPVSSAAVMNACRSVCGPIGLTIPARRAAGVCGGRVGDRLRAHGTFRGALRPRNRQRTCGRGSMGYRQVSWLPQPITCRSMR